MLRQFELVEQIKAYYPDVDEDLVNRAYVYAMKKHGSQKRASGDPYFSHPLEVAGILTDMKLDTASVITALLHDTVEDTDATLEEIEDLFGKDIAKLVDGVTKLTKIEFQTAQSKQAENFRKLVLAMSEDIRVLLVKLADRLHNMRTLHHTKPEKQRRIALETLEIYVPLAERIGVQSFKEELEDIAFGVLNPEGRESIVTRLNFLRTEGEGIVEKVIDSLERDLKETGIDLSITGREKTPYSIWRKMQRKNISFEQLSDIMAFRCIVPTVADCYHILGIIHSKYPTVPGRFKDYISLPKNNGYRSLHTTVIGPENQRIEIQIRTQEMHAEAELGVAAHWVYKDDNAGPSKTDGKNYRWLRELMDIVENAPKAEEFLENTKLELYQDRVFCFSPQGDLIELASGSTPVDFAYAVHSQVGDHCTGSKVNGRIVPLNTKLKNGDQVEITTNKNSSPNPNWERFVATGKARARIRRFVRLQQREQYESLGKAMLQKVYKQEDKNFDERALNKITKQFRVDVLADLYSGIGSGHIQGRDVFKAVFPDHKAKPATPKKKASGASQTGNKKKGKSQPMPIKGLIPGMALHFARCCHPIPGDKIVGIVTTGRGVTIHTVDCDTLESFADTPERWLDISWEDSDEGTNEAHTARLSIIVSNEPGALGTISTVIGQAEGNITNLKIVNRDMEFYEMLIDVFVKNTKHLKAIMSALRTTPEIVSVQRAKGR